MKTFKKLMTEYNNDMNMALVADIMQIYKDAKKRGKTMSFSIKADESGQIKEINYNYSPVVS